MFFFMTYMLPKFMTIFQGLNVDLPMMTQILIGISHLFSGYWWLMLCVIAVGAILFKRFQASAEGRRKLDEWKMSAPVFGKVVKLNLSANLLERFPHYWRTACRFSRR
jgi:type II secretory pathway component PulF